eukprot:403332264
MENFEDIFKLDDSNNFSDPVNNLNSQHLNPLVPPVLIPLTDQFGNQILNQNGEVIQARVQIEGTDHYSKKSNNNNIKINQNESLMLPRNVRSQRKQGHNFSSLANKPKQYQQIGIQGQEQSKQNEIPEEKDQWQSKPKEFFIIKPQNPQNPPHPFYNPLIPTKEQKEYMIKYCMDYPGDEFEIFQNLYNQTEATERKEQEIKVIAYIKQIQLDLQSNLWKQFQSRNAVSSFKQAYDTDPCKGIPKEFFMLSPQNPLNPSDPILNPMEMNEVQEKFLYEFYPEYAPTPDKLFNWLYDYALFNEEQEKILCQQKQQQILEEQKYREIARSIVYQKQKKYKEIAHPKVYQRKLRDEEDREECAEGFYFDKKAYKKKVQEVPKQFQYQRKQ